MPGVAKHPHKKKNQEGCHNLKGTVSLDFRPFSGQKLDLGPQMNRKKRFREIFLFARYARKKCVAKSLTRGHDNDKADTDGKLRSLLTDLPKDSATTPSLI